MQGLATTVRENYIFDAMRCTPMRKTELKEEDEELQ
jgi:hypothetical protein